ncbi:MAG: hypothetical protein IJL25_04995 [Clostridia bacterium]|nr:hypothetical protein [Clostridia bacterium]
MTTETNYNSSSRMTKGFPKIKKLGAVSPNGESTPFVFRGRSYRLELSDPTRGLDRGAQIAAVIRERETGNIVSRLAEDCYYHSLYQENGTVFVIGVKSEKPAFCGDTFMIYESSDLINWSKRVLLSNPGWNYFNSSLTKGPDGYVLCMEAGYPPEHVGPFLFTCFFATSPDMVHWTFMDYGKGFSKERYMGGPWLRYSRGWYYLISVTELPGRRYTNYIYRTRDFETWHIGDYNPILMPGDDDRLISPYVCDMPPQKIEELRTGFISSNSDIDMCDLDGKTLITYNAGNQLGFYYLAEAEYDGTVDEFLAAFFE